MSKLLITYGDEFAGQKYIRFDARYEDPIYLGNGLYMDKNKFVWLAVNNTNEMMPFNRLEQVINVLNNFLKEIREKNE